VTLLAAAFALAVGSFASSALFAPPRALAAGGVSINGDASVTKDATVEVTIPAPTGAQSVIRLSNDGASWSAPQPWASAVSWSLVDGPGGAPGDGTKTIYVTWDDGTGAWQSAGQDSIVFDTTAPDLNCIDLSAWGEPQPWRIVANDWCSNRTPDPEKFYELSLNDGQSWWPRFGEPDDGSFPDRFFNIDLRTMLWGGSWTAGNRSVCIRVTDPAGNVSAPRCQSFYVSDGSGLSFEFPRPAVTGELFTIRPVFPPGHTFSSDANCLYVLNWGDSHLTGAIKNEHFGSVRFTRKASDGGCGEWTFTLPYTAGGHYHFQFQSSDGYSASSWPIVTTFRAAVGTMERGIPQSNIPLVYLLPDKLLVQVGEQVTYTLKGTPGVTPPTGWFWTYGPSGPNAGFDQYGGSTFTFAPNEEGDWHTGWTGQMYGFEARAEFDPPADRKPPVLTAPRPIVDSASSLTATAPVRIGWTATDPKLKNGRPGSGLTRSLLQVSRNGGKWTNVALAELNATSVTANLLTTGSYRYRVRAEDRAGNLSAWVAGPTFKPRLVQEAATALKRTGAWSAVSGSTFSGGNAVESVTANAAISYTFTGRGIAWIGRSAPGGGFAQVIVDGVVASTVDVSAPSTNDRQILYSRSWDASGTHTVTVRVLGTFMRPNVSVDAFLVLK
jgi:hypothetical protein